MSEIWQNNLNKLTRFKSKYGHVSVPKSYTDKTLFNLVTTLRVQKRNGTLTPDRELALHQIGFDFDPIYSHWENLYIKVIAFFRLNEYSSPNRRSEK